MVDSTGKLITSEPPDPRTVPPELMGELLDTWEYVNRHELYIDLHHRMLGTVERFICAHVGESRGWERGGGARGPVGRIGSRSSNGNSFAR